MEGHVTPELTEKTKNREYRLLFGDFIEDKKIYVEQRSRSTYQIVLE